MTNSDFSSIIECILLKIGKVVKMLRISTLTTVSTGGGTAMSEEQGPIKEKEHRFSSKEVEQLDAWIDMMSRATAVMEGYKASPGWHLAAIPPKMSWGPEGKELILTIYYYEEDPTQT